MNLSIRAKALLIDALCVAAVVSGVVLPATSSAAGNGNIMFHRGFAAAIDIPENRNAQLYTIDPATGTETLFGNGSQPNFSFDGKKVAFIDDGQLFIGSASGSGTAKGLVVPNGGSAEIGLYPKVSPNNSQVAYQVTACIAPGCSALVYHIYVINAGCILDNNQYRDAALCNESELNHNGTSAFIHPAWHPFADAVVPNQWKLVFVSTSGTEAAIDAGNYTGDIFTEDVTIAPNGVATELPSTKVNLTNSPAKYSFPTFSHNGTKIAYVKTDANGSDALYVANANGSGAIAILSASSGQITMRNPAWSPDDQKIAYSDSIEIFQITTDTFQVTQVTTGVNAAADAYPTWAQAVVPSLTELLFPFVSNQLGFDTSITVANTSSDPYGTTPLAGTCVINFYGSGAPSPAQTTTSTILPGQVYAATLSTLAPGFQGYMTATCNFPLARGGTFLTRCAARGANCVAEQTFTPAEVLRALMVTTNGSGVGTVSSAPASISCGAICLGQYAVDTPITLASTADASSVFTGWLGICTGQGPCNVYVNGRKTTSSTFAPSNIGVPRIDIDGNSSYDAMTDGLLIIRYLFGLTGQSLIAGALGPGATLTDAAKLLQHLADIRPIFDVDGNGNVDALTDGVMMIRYLFGSRGPALIQGAIGPGATRSTAAQIETYIHSLVP